MVLIVSFTRVQASEAQDIRVPCKNISPLGRQVIKLIGAHQVHHVVSTHKASVNKDLRTV